MFKLLQKHASAASFVPTDSAGCTLWLKADFIGGLSDGDPISTWEDASTANNDATGVTTTRATYQTNEIDSKPSVRFDGTDDFFTLTSIISNTNPYTLFMVYKKRTTAVKLPTLGSSADPAMYAWYDFSDDNVYVFANLNAFYTAAAGFTTHTLIVEIENGTGVAPTARKNGASFSLSPGSGTSGMLGYDQVGRRGTTEYADGDIVELIYYDHTATSTLITDVETYLHTKYPSLW